LIRDRTRDFGSVIDEPPSQAASPELRRKQVDQSTLKTQMTDLAAALCSNMEDKMRAASR
jgi:nuclear pore complex protein Nup133